MDGELSGSYTYESCSENAAPTIDLSSSSFTESGIIPDSYACSPTDFNDGGISPALNWEGNLLDAQSFALIVDDPDAPDGVFTHWVLYNIPADTRSLAEGVSTTALGTMGAIQGLNDFGLEGYFGPCPPPGETHQYRFTIYALDGLLGTTVVSREELLLEMTGKILAQDTYVGSYGQTVGNQKPVAEGKELTVSQSETTVQVQLSGSDPDGDSVTFELLSSQNTSAYQYAYINPTSGMLNLAVIDRSSPINLEYHISDGSLYSDPQQVKINFEASGEDKEGGLLDINPTDYSGFEIVTFNGYLQGVANDNPEFPKKIDLSPNFPPIGNQKTQSSCVGWAVAYSLKTYQERLDQGWTLNTNEHIFSPAFVYNQINGGFDQGSYIHEALQLLVDVGAATWSYMPYFEYDYLSQPNFLALLQASDFKAKRWARVSDRINIQAALANRLPVVAGMLLPSSAMMTLSLVDHLKS
jgi:Raf kinase inhibitor-like YbhB/YbcL family protein